MTTIAYRDGVLAADSMISYNSYNNGETRKIARCGRHFVALAGAAYLRLPLEEWVSAGANDHEVPQVLMDNRGQFSALVMDSAGDVFEFDNGFLLQVHADYTAIGSGALFALGAMAHGASPMEAVEAASKHDKSSGGEITFAEAKSLLN